MYDKDKYVDLGFEVDLVIERVGKEDFFYKLIPVFVEELKIRLEELKKERKRYNYKKCKSHLHSIVGTAITVGHRKLYEKSVKLDNYLAMDERKAFRNEIEQYFEYCSDLLSKL